MKSPIPAALKNVAAALDVGSEVPVNFYRDGAAKTAQVKIVELPPAPEVLATFGFGVRERPAPKTAKAPRSRSTRLSPAVPRSRKDYGRGCESSRSETSRRCR